MANRFDLLQKEFISRRLETLNPKPAIVVTPDAPIEEAIGVFRSRNIGCVLVTDPADTPVGILTERDIIKKFALDPKADPAAKVRALMTPRPECIRSSGSIARLLNMMANGRFRHVPVLCPKEPRLCIVSIKDVVEHLHRRITSKILDAETAPTIEAGNLNLFFNAAVESLPFDPVISVHEKAGVREALEQLRKWNKGCVAVVNDAGRVRGIFSERDYVRRVFPRSAHSKQLDIENFMTTSPKTVTTYSSIAFAFQLLTDGGYRHLPIVDDDGKIAGMLSARTIVDVIARDIIADLEAAAAE